MHGASTMNRPGSAEERRELLGHVERHLGALLEMAKGGDLAAAAGSRVLVDCLIRHVQGVLAVLDTLLEPSSPYHHAPLHREPMAPGPYEATAPRPGYREQHRLSHVR